MSSSSSPLDPSPAPPPERNDAVRATERQERGALVFSIIAVMTILVISSPCVCYFGAGLFQGVSTLRTGQQNNPARQGFERQKADWRGNYKRPERYNRTFERPKDAEQPEAAE